MYISKVHIEGFKKFRSIDIEFNKDISILVGDNESGKSTVLEAIDLALNHSINSFDLSMLSVLLNKDDRNDFIANKTIDSLPKILIQIYFEGMDGIPKYAQYYGQNYGKCVGEEKYGIEFIAEFDKDFESPLSETIKKGIIPVEYYKLSTKTFGNVSYRPGFGDVSFCLVNISNNNAPSFCSYSKMIFKQLVTPDDQVLLKNAFCENVDKAISDTMKIVKEKDYPSFDRDIQKSSFENIISIYEDKIPLNMKGQGRETYIKTEMMIDSKKRSAIIAIEEPENHLSHSSMTKMISLIKEKQADKQIILTSHSNRIASGIGLNKIIMLSDESDPIMLNNINRFTADYFRILPNDNLLYFVLSKKIILVEGPAELIYMDYFYKKMYPGSSLEKDDITCLSVNGLSFKHFVRIAKLMGKKIVVITDNDSDIEKFSKLKKDLQNIYEEESKFNVYSDSDADNRTFEICLYNENKELIQSILRLQETADYENEYSRGDKYLGKMLNNKTGTAIQISQSDGFIDKVNIPQYIKEALQFIHND